MSVLLINTGSSSLKFSVLEASDGTVLASGMADWAGDKTHYQLAMPDCKVSDTVDWKGPKSAFARSIGDLRRTLPCWSFPPCHTLLALILPFIGPWFRLLRLTQFHTSGQITERFDAMASTVSAMRIVPSALPRCWDIQANRCD